MLWFLRPRPAPDARIEERWGTRFGWLERGRLEEEDTPAFATRKKGGRFTLELKRRNLFAWSVSRLYRYRDFVLATRFRLEAGNGQSAAGIVFRYIDEENFYYFLVSSRGSFRLDAVVNGHPAALIEWTECPFLKAEEIELRAIARGDHFSFYAAEEWLAEIEDERLGEGTLGLAAQNFDERDRAVYEFQELQVDSRPVEVEKAFERWVRVLPADPACRMALGRTFFAMGRYNLAAVQVRRALRQGRALRQERALPPDPLHPQRAAAADDRFFLGEILLRLGLHEEALAAFEACLRLAPGRQEALLEKANLLYLMGRHLEAREAARQVLPHFERNPVLVNLLGNVEYALGNWEPALAAYRSAAALEPESGLFRLHAARSLERLGRAEEALAAYLEAARLLFRQEELADLELILARLKKLDAQNPEVLAIEARLLFRDGKLEEAERIFSRLIEAGTDDSAVHFLHGLVLAGRGERREAAGHLAAACRLEPAYPLYWLRLAENLHLLGEDPHEALGNAIRLAPGDPWVNNLLGMVRLEAGRLEEAGEALRKALEAAPGEADILINYSEYLDRAGQRDRALEILAEAAGAPSAAAAPAAAAALAPSAAVAALGTSAAQAALANHRGNLLARAGRTAEAVRDYERAVRLEPDNPRYAENCAGACIELDMILRAEELLGRLLERAPSPSVYGKVGNLAALKREHARAEAAYREGLRLDPGDRDLQLNLAALQLERNDYHQAKEAVGRLLAQDPGHAGGLRLLERIRARYETRLACDACGREWWTPREVPPQPAMSVRGEPPGEAPAGQCEACGRVYCVACAAEHLREGRFICPHDEKPLRFTDERLKYLLRGYLQKELEETAAADNLA